MGPIIAFVDIQVYYSDDELCKQADLLVDKRVVTGQEWPVTDRTLRSDLYKRQMSADPVAGRSPHGIVARMTPCILQESQRLPSFQLNAVHWSSL